MCIMHAPINRKAPKVHRSVKKDVKVSTPFNEELLKPDPDFIDERKAVRQEPKSGFFGRLLGV